MSRPLRPCLEPGCSLLVPKGRCPTHAQQYDRRRGTVKQRGYSGARHRNWRAKILERDPICTAVGCGKRSKHADHIIPLSMGGTWDVANGQGFCHSHHSQKTAREQRDPWLGIRQREAPQHRREGEGLHYA